MIESKKISISMKLLKVKKYFTKIFVFRELKVGKFSKSENDCPKPKSDPMAITSRVIAGSDPKMKKVKNFHFQRKIILKVKNFSINLELF